MSQVFIFSDPHFGHENLAKMRGFSCSQEHDEFIIKNWNKVCCKRDVIWLLGDITMETSKHYHLLDRLNGTINIVLGNHDRRQDVKHLLEHVNSVCGMKKYKNSILTHAPIHINEIGRFKTNIHGHMHFDSIDDDRYINVCAEMIDYTPQLISDYI